MRARTLLRLFAWNVNGVRAAQRKGLLDWLHSEQPDILGMGETKAAPEQLEDALRAPPGYHSYWARTRKLQRKGYSGTALLSRVRPRSVLTSAWALRSLTWRGARLSSPTTRTSS